MRRKLLLVRCPNAECFAEEGGGGVAAASVSFCAFAPLYAEAQMQRDIDGGEHIQRP